MVVARRREARAGGLVKIGLRVVAWDRAGAVAAAAIERFLAQAAAFVDLEQVDRNVLGIEAQQFADGALPGFARLVREAGDQVHADVAKAGGAKDFDGAENIFAAVHAAGGLQFAIVKGLRAEADAVESGVKPGGGFDRRDRLGIGLERRLLRLDAIGIAERVEDSREGCGREEAWRSAAEVDCVDLLLAGIVRGLGDLAADGCGVGLVAVARDHAGVEIAVGAFRLAERHLDVCAEGDHLSRI